MQFSLSLTYVVTLLTLLVDPSSAASISGRSRCRARSSASQSTVALVASTSTTVPSSTFATSAATSSLSTSTTVLVASSISSSSTSVVVASSTSTAAASSSTSSGSNGSRASDSDVSLYLSLHDSVRAQYGAGDLAWNNTLAVAAQTWSDACVFEHSGGSLGPYGENLAAGTGSYSITSGVTAWTNEASQYNSNDPQASHFTQVVWKSTTQVGCALSNCAGGTIFPSSYGTSNYVVCEYYPQGNVIGEFAQNVQA